MHSIAASSRALTFRSMQLWSPTETGILRLPSGRLVRGRGLRHDTPSGQAPEFGVYLLAKPPPAMAWRTWWVRWPDWWLPMDSADAHDALLEAWRRAAHERVEVACSGGRGRTGTALALLAAMDGIPRTEAVEYVRRGYHRRSVETPWQRRYVARSVPGLR
jgi:hypothetical protein